MRTPKFDRDGRVLYFIGSTDEGVGAGWLKNEFDALGIRLEDAGAMTDECLRVYRIAWEQDYPEFHGRFYDFAELTELHHNRKADAPSGTCIKTAELMEELGKSFNPLQVEEHETLAGCRGGQRDSGHDHGGIGRTLHQWAPGVHGN